MTSYTFRLNQFRITNTRAVHHDTDYVTFALQVGSQRFPVQKKFMGDVNNGTHSVDLQFGPIQIDDPNTPVTLSYHIINSGHAGDAQLYALLEQGADAILDAALDELPGGAIIAQVAKLLVSLFVVDCDGVVAADSIRTTGNALASQTAEHGQWVIERFYHGTDTAWGCGSNSEYAVTLAVAPVAPDVVELWRATWTTGWTNFVPFTLADQQPYYLAYKTGDGEASIDRVRPNGIDVDTQWGAVMPTGWTSVFGFRLADEPYFLAHTAPTHEVKIYSIHPDAKGIDLRWGTTWGNDYQVFAPFQLSADAYYLTYRTSVGDAYIDRINPGGQDVTTVFAARWTLGWTHFAPFVLNGRPYYLAYKMGVGYVSIDWVQDGATGVDTLWTGNIAQDFTAIDPFTLDSRQYFLCYNAQTGYVSIYLLLPGNSGLKQVWQGHWTTGWTSFVPFQLGDQPCHLVYKRDQGTVVIDRYRARS